jgi:orotate phosphoribosyltransferase
MRARGALDGRTFVIVDDVVTSGATIGEAARAIRAAGGQVDGAVALAFTPRNREGSH